MLLTSCSFVVGASITIDNSSSVQGAIDSSLASDVSGVVNLKSGTYKLGGNCLNLSYDKLIQ